MADLANLLQCSRGQEGERIPPNKMLRGREESHKRLGGKASCMAGNKGCQGSQSEEQYCRYN